MKLVDPFYRPQPGSLSRYDQTLLLSSLLLLACLCWLYLFSLSSNMPMEMGSSSVPMSNASESMSWSISYSWMMFVMWVIMMAGMMVPTAIRAIMIYAQINAQSLKRGRLVVSAYWFAAGYLLIWTLFSLAATGLQRFFDQMSLLSSGMSISSFYLGAVLLISAGIWQLSPVKKSCLKHCRSPMGFIAGNYRPGVRQAIKLGASHGVYCLGCCWLIMCLLFIGGVMNLLWIASITGFVLVEKLLSTRFEITRKSGWVMILLGGLLIVLELIG